jgi:mutator protein MutT
MTKPIDTRRTLLFLRKNNHILLAMKKRGFGADRWNGVGGKLEPGETIEQALVRECQEEICVTPKTYHLVAEHDFQGISSQREAWNMYAYVYFCDEWEGEPTETEEMAPEWFPIGNLPYKNMWQDDEYWLPQVLADKRVLGTYTFDENDTMLNHTIDIVEILPSEKQLL